MSNLYALDETLDMLNGTNYTSFEGLAEAVLIESRDFCSFIESQNIILEKIDFSKIKEKAKQAWERIKAKIKALIAKIEYFIRELVRKSKKILSVKKIIPDKFTLKTAKECLNEGIKAGLIMKKDIIAQMRGKDNLFDEKGSGEKAEKLMDEYLKTNPVEVEVIDDSILEESDTKIVTNFIKDSSEILDKYERNCKDFEKYSNEYFKSYFSYDQLPELDDVKKDSTELYSHKKINAINKPGEYLRYDALFKGETDSKYFVELKTPETFKKKITINSYNDFANIEFDTSYAETYIDLLFLKDKEESLVNNLRLIIKSGDNTINKIKSNLHVGEKDPSMYMRWFIESCTELMNDGIKFSTTASHYESYYRKLYNETVQCVMKIATKMLTITSKAYVELKKEK